MKKILLLIFICCQIVLPQRFESKSGRLNINIKYPPPDSLTPILKITKPPKLRGFPIYSIDPIYSVKGFVEDNSGKVKIKLNDELKGIFTNGPLSIESKLSQGQNILVFDVFDKRDNHTMDTLIIFFDSKADITPPIIKITEPSTLAHRGIKIIPKYSTKDSLFLIKGKVSDENNIYGVWVNSIPIDSLFDDQFQFVFNDGMPDSITLTAADSYGNLSSDTYFAYNTTSEPLDTAQISYHALIITVQDYRDKNIDPLEYPIVNGDALRNVLISNYTFKNENIYSLKNPTRAQILLEFQRLRKTLKESDNLLIFYAGHGYWDSEIQQGYWLPVDAMLNDPGNWLANSDIKDFIRGIKTKHTLLIADACFAGNFFRSLQNSSNTEVSFNALYQYQSRKALTSGALDSKVLDKSVFAKYLIQKLTDNSEKYWESEKLYQSMKDAVRYNTPNRQVPQWGIIEETGDDGFGDFIFIHK